MDKAAREKARELCGRFSAGPWAILNYVEAAPYPNYHQAIAVSAVIDANKSIVDEHSVRELAVAASTLLPQTLDALDAADSDNARLRARVSELEAALANEREACAKVADDYAAPNRFSVAECWKDNQSPSEVYDTAAIDVGGWIAQEIRARSRIPAPPVGDR